MFWDDPELRALFQEGMQKASAERCERNFRRSLILYSAQLRSQGSTPEEKQAARVVKYFSRNTARLFRSKIDINLQKRKLKSTQYRVIGEGDAVPILGLKDNLDDDNDGDDDDDSGSELSETEIKFQHLESFLQGSDAFLALKDSFRLFVHPDPVRKAMLEVWPLSQPRRFPHWISYQMKWDVLELLKKKFLEGQKVGDVLTITSDSELSSGKDLPNAQAISCRDYLLANWLDLGSCWIKNMILEKTEVSFTMENILYLY
jgi:hypothetical protein